jgi:hypothetical protein
MNNEGEIADPSARGADAPEAVGGETVPAPLTDQIRSALGARPALTAVSRLTDQTRAALGEGFALPLMTRVTRALNLVVWLLVVNTMARLVWELGLTGLLVYAITEPARAGIPGWGGWLLVIGFTVLVSIVGYQIARRLRPKTRIYRWMFGRPAFGVLGGPESRILTMTMSSLAAMKLIFRREDDDYFGEQQELDEQTIEAIFRDNYNRVIGEKDSVLAGTEWSTVWPELLAREIDGVSFADAIRSRAYGALLYRLRSEHMLTAPIVALLSLVTGWLGVRAALHPDTSHLLLFGQVALLGGLLLALLLCVNHIHMFAQLTVFGDKSMSEAEVKIVPESLRDRYKAHIDLYKGRVIKPESFEYDSRFVRAASRYFSWIVTAWAVMNAVIIAPLVVLATVVGLVVSDHSTSELLTYAARMLCAIGALPVLMLIGLVLGFTLMQNARRFTYLLLAGAILAFLPQGITFFLTGKVSAGQLGVISSVVTAVIGALGAAVIAELINSPRSR